MSESHNRRYSDNEIERRECSDCADHTGHSEQLKKHEEMVKVIPELMTFMNTEKGKDSASRWLIGLFFSVLIAGFVFFVVGTKADIVEKQTAVKEQQATIHQQIDKLMNLVNRVDKTVDLLNNRFEMRMNQADKDNASNAKKISELEARHIKTQ